VERVTTPTELPDIGQCCIVALVYRGGVHCWSAELAPYSRGVRKRLEAQVCALI